MKYIIVFLLASILFTVATSLYIYHGKGHTHTEQVEGNIFPMEDVMIDIPKSFQATSEDKVVCYRESHRNFYVFTFQLALVIVALTSYGIVTKVRLSKRLTKQNEELATSREVLERTNQAMLAGIRYARRIQNSMLPTPGVLSDIAAQSFVFYQPKDVVSGDFYWAGSVGKYQLVCVADSTGHGVPGAFLATVGLNILRTVIESEFMWQPAAILGRVNQLLMQSLGSSDEGLDTDGIEMTIFCLDREAGEVRFAGARGIALMVSGSSPQELKGDRITLGHEADPRFTEHCLPLCEGDWFFQFTDGFADQFGGPENKKYSRARLKHTLLDLSQQVGAKHLHGIFSEWKSSTHQVDDVLVIGFQA